VFGTVHPSLKVVVPEKVDRSDEKIQANSPVSRRQPLHSQRRLESVLPHRPGPAYSIPAHVDVPMRGLGFGTIHPPTRNSHQFLGWEHCSVSLEAWLLWLAVHLLIYIDGDLACSACVCGSMSRNNFWLMAKRPARRSEDPGVH